MKWTAALLLPLLGWLLLSATAGEDNPTIGKIVRLDPRFDKLIPPDARLEKLAGGFKWTEGPVWVKNGGYLLFSDIPNNSVNKWRENKTAKSWATFVNPAGFTDGAWPRPGAAGRDEPGTNGLRLDAQGRLVACCHGDRAVIRIDEVLGPDSQPLLGADNVKKKRTILADRWQGKRFNSPNDLVFHSNGDLYFTDPPYGLPKGADDPARELDFCGVYRLKKDGSVQLLSKDVSRPNGIAFSPDEKTLYVANSDPARAVWYAYGVQDDGSIDKGRVLFDATEFVKAKKPGLPDGLKVDVHGNLFATGPGGVHVFASDGTLLGTLDTGVPTANCAFGDDGTLYVAANTDIARIRTTTKGLGQ